MSERPPVLRCERRGSGAPLVLLPGVGERWTVWGAVLDRLAERFEVIAVDLPGLGSPPLPAAPRPGVEELARAVGGWLEARVDGRPHVAGHGLGGAIALELAKGGLAKSVCAFSPIGLARSRPTTIVALAGRGVQALWRRACRRTRLMLSVPAVRAVVLRRYLLRPWRLVSASALATYHDVLSDASTVTVMLPRLWSYSLSGAERAGVPITVAWGSGDLLRVSYARGASRRLPAARRVRLAGCAGVPMVENPTLTVATILAATNTVSETG